MRGIKPDAETKTSASTRSIQPQFVWLDLIKAIALMGIFFNHIVERIFGYPEIANPGANWPAFSERLAQLRPLAKFGIWNTPLNLLRYAGWFGEHGVELFLVASGFGLTWGLIARHGNTSLPLRSFYRRRAERIYPLWWGTHLLFMALWLMIGWGLSMANPDTYMSMIGIRLTPSLLYYFAPAWWYIGLLLQLYLIYPLLWEALRRWGPLMLLIGSCILAFAARAIGSLIFTEYLDAWLRGAIFITRLPEFVFGISLAAWMYRDPEQTDSRLRAPSALILAIAACVLSFPLALTLPGMTVVPFFLGAGLLVVLYSVLGGIKRREAYGVRFGVWIGRHSYSLYLIHHPLILLLIPAGLSISARSALVGTFLVILVMIVGAVTLEWVVDKIQATLALWNRKAGRICTALRVSFLIIAVGIALIGAELAVRQLAPQEVLGWGERPSLEPDPTLGWRLKPSQTTRLRWEGYDYTVTSNSLGFPGPEYPEQKEPRVIRIMTVGDAFTSAEGVNTDQAWPRLLEAGLAERLPGRRVEVLNFGITAYGPIQYALLIEKYAPIYRPDLIILGFFVNEYQDVLMDVEKYRKSSGFDLPSQNSWQALARLAHLRRFIRLQLIEPFMELVRGKPREHGYLLGNFLALEKGRPDINVTGRQMVADRLKQIKTIADRVGAKVVIAMIPAPVQVCTPEQLDYYPRHVDLNDRTRFDLEQPQRMTQEIASSLDFVYYDLLPVLKSAPGGCPYQSKNMHWTAAGHRSVADYLTQMLSSDGQLSFIPNQ